MAFAFIKVRIPTTKLEFSVLACERVQAQDFYTHKTLILLKNISNNYHVATSSAATMITID
jgi:hypothetical protein